VRPADADVAALPFAAASVLVEAAVETLQGALAAERGGANRIELCANLSEGGTTPNEGLIATVTERTHLPVFVLIRQRTGGFVYSENEIDSMTHDIETARRMGIAGIVTGALTADALVDIEHTRILLNAAAELPVTFHRAFDFAVNLPHALEQLIDLGVSRVLTSGGRDTALGGADIIAALVDQARGRIALVAGGGIREDNVREVISRTGVHEVHTRLIDEARIRALVDVATRA
jgi:copper homeostasis protein